MRFGAKTLTLAAVAAGTVLTLGVILLPGVGFAYRNPSFHVAIDTFDAVIALLVAFLLYGRFARSRRLRDQLVTYALLIFGLGNMFLSAIPATLSGTATDDLTTWGTLINRTVGGVLMLAAAFAEDREVGRRGRSGASLFTSAAGVVLIVGAVVTILAPSLPPAVEELATSGSTNPRLTGHILVVVLHVALMVMFAVTAYRFTALSEDDRDELMRWLGAGAGLAAFAQLNYLLYPSLFSDYVYSGDIFRTGFYLMLLIGAGREIASYWRGIAETAVAEERRRMARDLHDGLAQELAFMWAHIQELRRTYPADDNVLRASGAAERALDESRRAIGTFSRSPNEPLDIAITSFIEEVARRLGARVRLDLAPGIEVETKLREDLLRVVREAVTNAARHGNAETITVELSRNGVLRLEICDDGEGFDTSEPPRPGSYGIASMRERVVNHGGRFEITSQPGQGTQVKAVLP